MRVLDGLARCVVLRTDGRTIGGPAAGHSGAAFVRVSGSRSRRHENGGPCRPRCYERRYSPPTLLAVVRGRPGHVSRRSRELPTVRAARGIFPPSGVACCVSARTHTRAHARTLVRRSYALTHARARSSSGSVSLKNGTSRTEQRNVISECCE